MNQQSTSIANDMHFPQGINPKEPIEITPVERILLSLGVGSLATFTALGEMNLAIISIAVLAVCGVLMVFRSDRSTRRSAMKLYPHMSWAEYNQSQPRTMWISMAIFAIIYLLALLINVYLGTAGNWHVLAAGILGVGAVVAVFFLPLFQTSENPQTELAEENEEFDEVEESEQTAR